MLYCGKRNKSSRFCVFDGGEGAIAGTVSVEIVSFREDCSSRVFEMYGECKQCGEQRMARVSRSGDVASGSSPRSYHNMSKCRPCIFCFQVSPIGIERGGLKYSQHPPQGMDWDDWQDSRGLRLSSFLVTSMPVIHAAQSVFGLLQELNMV
jgi:hypothetical protein